MGIRIIDQNSVVMVIEPFTKTEFRTPLVQCWCNVQTHQHNLIYTGVRKKRAVADGGFRIEFSIPAFRIIAKMGNDALKEFTKKTKGDSRILFSNKPINLDADMHQCIYAISNCNEHETVKPMFLYARIIDLLMLQQLNYIRTQTPQPVYVKTEYDKERIVFARDYLLTHMDAPPTLSRLSAIAGINEFKLKRGFKELFNNTVFGYLANVRLEMARTALRQKQKPVTQIAFELGYASLQHFSMVFKKKFGVSPREFR